MNASFDIYPEQVRSRTEQRQGHGTILLTETLEVVFMDDRGRTLCEEIRHAEAHSGSEGLPKSLVKLCGEIKDVLPLRNHPKDWEEFAVKRVVGGEGRHVFACGIGLPPLTGERTEILLTLDYIGSRSGPRLEKSMEHFKLTQREVMVVEGLLEGWTNKKIATELKISEQTVKEHLKHIMEKTGTTTRTAILTALSRLD